jgi:WD40 repeat protein
MARPNFGPKAHQRARKLFTALLRFANDEIEDADSLCPHLQVHWQTNQRLVVRTKIRYLEALTDLSDSLDKLEGPHIKAALKRFEDLLGILEDNRAAAQGSDIWHFTLNLWYPRFEIDNNLRRFDQVWEAARPTKSRQVGGDLSTAATASQVAQPDMAAAQPNSGNEYTPSPTARVQNRCSWGEALDVASFYGRQTELETLRAWVTADRCRLITLLGMGGIGKTALSVKLARDLQNQFDRVIWRSLRNAPPVEDLLEDVLLTLFDQQQEKLPTGINRLIATLLDQFQQSRCLLVLDNVESILQGGEASGRYRRGYEEYGHLLRSLGETVHDSCLILTSREKPSGLSAKEGPQLPARAYQLTGIDTLAATQILQDKGVDPSTLDCNRLIAHYDGNPLALKIAATTIQELFAGDLAAFLSEGAAVFGDISDLLHQQVSRLSSLELQVMQWLAVSRQGISLKILQPRLIPAVSTKALLVALESLERRSLLEVEAGNFAQQPVVMEYITDLIIEQVCSEFETASPQLLSTLALSMAQAEDYLRHNQLRLIVTPIAERLQKTLGSAAVINQHCQDLLDVFKAQPPRQPGYGPGNLLTLMNQLQLDLRGYDFSNLAVWQVYLPAIALPEMNFSGADFSRSVFNEMVGGILAATYRPNGRQIATAISENIEVWDLATAQPQLTCQGHADWVTCLTYHPNSMLLASGSNDATIRLWDAETGQCLKTLSGHDSWIQALAFCPGADQLASGSNDTTIRLWHIVTGECEKTLVGHRDRILALHWHPDGTTLVSSSLDGTIRLWDTTTGECIKEFPISINWALAVDLSPDGLTLVTGSDGTTVKFWDLATGTCQGTLPDYECQVWSVMFSPTGDHILTAGEDQTLKLWDIESGRCLKTLLGHRGRVWLVVYSPDGHTCLSASDDQTLKLWDVATGQCLKTFTAYSNWMQSVAISPTGQLLASSSEDQVIRLWDMQTGSCVQTLQGHTKLIMSVVFSPDGTRLASASDDQTLRVWHVTSGACEQILRGHEGWIPSVAFSPDGTTLTSGSYDGTVRLWDIQSGECLQRFTEHSHRVKAVAFHPMGHQIASSSDDKTIKVWDITSGECLRTLTGHQDWVVSVAFHPQGQVLASGSADHTVRMWNGATGEMLQTLTGHTQRVRGIAFSACGQYLASCGDDHTILLWQVATGECLKTLSGHTGTVWSVAFSPDSSVLASCSEDGTLRLWEWPPGSCIQTLRPERPYEGMNIKGAIGLTPTQRKTLLALGAVEI